MGMGRQNEEGRKWDGKAEWEEEASRFTLHFSSYRGVQMLRPYADRHIHSGR